MGGYLIWGSDNEILMVIRSYDEDMMLGIINKLKKSREEEVKKLAEILENHFYERDNDRGSSIKVGPKDSQNGGQRGSGRNTKTKNPKPIIKRST